MANQFFNLIDLKSNKIINLANASQDNDAINLSQLNSAVEGVLGDLSSALTYLGNFDASVGSFSALTDASQGDYYVVSVAGTIGSIEYNVGDHIVVNKDVVGTPAAADIDLIKNTQFPDTVYLDAIQTLVSKTIDADFNTVVDLTVANLKAGVLNLDLDSSVGTDTELASVLAVQTHVATEVEALEAKLTGLKFAYDIVGDDTTTDFVVNHNLDCLYPIVRVMDSSNAIVFAEIVLTDASNISVNFDSAPIVSEDYKVIVLGTNFASEGSGLEYSPEDWFQTDAVGGSAFSPSSTAKITGLSQAWIDYSGPLNKNELVIPETIGGNTIAEIGLVDTDTWQGVGQDSITSINMPHITTVSESAFDSHTALISVDMPLVTNLGFGSFFACTALTSVDMPVVTSVEMYTFKNCSSLTSVDILLVTSVGSYAFAETGLTSVNMPSVTSVGNSPFDSCAALTSVSMPSVTSIDYSAFSGCTVLSQISIAANVSVSNASIRGNFTNVYETDNGSAAGLYEYDETTWAKTA